MGQTGFIKIQKALAALLKEHQETHGMEETVKFLEFCGWTKEMINNIIKTED